MDDFKSNLDLNGKETSNKQQQTNPVQGRYIVHPKDIKELQIHEIFVDFQDGMPDEQGKIIRRGSFTKVKEKLVSYLGNQSTHFNSKITASTVSTLWERSKETTEWKWTPSQNRKNSNV